MHLATTDANPLNRVQVGVQPPPSQLRINLRLNNRIMVEWWMLLNFHQLKLRILDKDSQTEFTQRYRLWPWMYSRCVWQHKLKCESFESFQCSCYTQKNNYFHMKIQTNVVSLMITWRIFSRCDFLCICLSMCFCSSLRFWLICGWSLSLVITYLHPILVSNCSIIPKFIYIRSK